MAGLCRPAKEPIPAEGGVGTNMNSGFGVFPLQITPVPVVALAPPAVPDTEPQPKPDPEPGRDPDVVPGGPPDSEPDSDPELIPPDLEPALV